MTVSTNINTSPACASCHRPVDERYALRLKRASWLCGPCAHDVAKAVRTARG